MPDSNPRSFDSHQGLLSLFALTHSTSRSPIKFLLRRRPERAPHLIPIKRFTSGLYGLEPSFTKSPQSQDAFCVLLRRAAPRLDDLHDPGQVPCGRREYGHPDSPDGLSEPGARRAGARSAAPSYTGGVRRLSPGDVIPSPTGPRSAGIRRNGAFRRHPTDVRRSWSGVHWWPSEFPRNGVDRRAEAAVPEAVAAVRRRPARHLQQRVWHAGKDWSAENEPTHFR